MHNNIYIIYNVLSKRYGDVVAYPSDAFAARRLSEVYKDHPEHLKEMELCRIGSVSIETGVVTPHDPIRIDLDVDPDSPLSLNE
ncbi:hypothetical protein [Tortoise microvirus 104]|nr:hypothetical protein [Tortoise microvirus 6]QCS37455.1 hypothetical protein [Tortoise microvirus 104]